MIKKPVLHMYTHNLVGKGTFGTIDLGDRIIHTVEREWLNNEPMVSCIPAGTYDVKPNQSPSKGETFILESDTLGVGVTKGGDLRTHCLIHVANWPKEVNGCIGVGNGWNGSWGVANSGATMKDLLVLYPDGFTLVIHRA